jgi:hypothetical protein
MPRTPLTSKQLAIKYAYRSGLEEKIADQLKSLNVSFTFEKDVLYYVKPERKHRYTPDFVLSNGIIIETKGRFLTADRQKHLLVKEQNPTKDIRFVFSNSKAKISKTSSTSYADWCMKHGFKFADRLIPIEWIKE